MDGLENLTDLQGNNVNDFVKSYRDTLKQDYDSNVAKLQQQRRNDYASIMSQANKRGMMYSNFPERSKLQYETDTYLPNLQSAYTTYQTGLDKLRSNALETYNNIQEINSNITALNNSTSGGIVGDYGEDAGGGVWYKDADGNKIRFSTFARNNGYDASTESYLQAAKDYMPTDTYNRLLRIVSAQQNTSHPNLLHNANSYGSTWQNYDYKKSDGTSYLSDEDRDFINSLGLTFGK